MTPETEHEIYQAVLRRISELMNANPNSQEGAELDFLVTVAESYEDRHFPVSQADSSDND